MPGSAPSPDRIERALALLAEEVRERVAGHPWGHLLGPGELLEVALRLPTARRDGLAAAAEELDQSLEEALAGLVSHRAAFRPGRVFCLRCRSADCDHAAPGGAREVFAGYGKTGVPRYLDLGQMLLDRGDPRVDRLWAEPPSLLAHTVSEQELAGELLAAFRDGATGYRIHGQVVAGWYRVPDPSGRPEPMALSLQVISTHPPEGRPRFGLNVLGTSPDGRPLEHLRDRLGELPWRDTVRWAQAALDQIERTQGGRQPPPGARRSGPAAAVDRRLDGLLQGIARRLEKSRRADSRRTRHARRRHAEGDRPTRLALADLAQAGVGDVMVDTRRETLVVLGDRGRAHVFSPAGKLVTSLRFETAAIERRRERRRWRPATAEEVAALRGRVAPDPAG